MTDKKWYRFNGAPITYWGEATEAQAIAYTRMLSDRYPLMSYTEVDGKPDDEAAYTIINVEAWFPAGSPIAPKPETFTPQCAATPPDYHILTIRDVVDMLTSKRLGARLRVENGRLIIAAEFQHWNHNSGQAFEVFHLPVSDSDIVLRQDYMTEIAGYLLRLSRGQSLPAPYLALKMAEA